MGAIPAHYILQPDGSYSAPPKRKATWPPPAQQVPLKSPLKRHGKYNVSAPAERTVDGITFDSKLEAKAYTLLKQYGQVFQHHQVFELQPAFKLGDTDHRAINYESDFVLTHPDGRRFVVDIKGLETDIFKIKRKMLAYRHHIVVHCIKSLKDLTKFLYDNGLVGPGLHTDHNG